MKRLLPMVITALLLLPGTALGADLPPWDYPLSPKIIADASQYLTLTNVECLLDKDYVPHDLVRLTAKRVSGMRDGELRKAASQAIDDMFAAALEDGYTLYVKSAYRSYGTQNTMYRNRLDKYGYDDGLVAYPGSSDHQTGLGVDVLNYEWTLKDGMNEKFAQTREAQWMAEHCHEYGFIIRYMEDKEDITGIKYEPWHLRYVGVEAATYIMENHLSLEEFTQEWQDYLADYESRGGNLKLLLLKMRQLPPIIEIPTEDGDIEFVFSR